jgi:hypothetical protein
MKKKALIYLTILALMLNACSLLGLGAEATPIVTDTPTTPPTETQIPPTETPTPTATATPEPLIVDYGPDNFPANVNPLTGLTVSDPTTLERLPISVKIQIFPRADRPPFGLSAADIVYDYYQNNGLTRFNAIFYGNDSDQVGPVRSGRLLDMHIIRMYKTFFVFGGADKKILNKLFGAEFSDRLLVEGPSNCPPMCRFDPNGYNFLMVDTKAVGPFFAGKGVTNSRQNLNGMIFQQQPPANGVIGTQIYLRYSISAYARWDFDPATGRYLRFQDTAETVSAEGESYEPLTDRLTGQQISADNVVILMVKHSYFYKSGNSEVIDIELTGSGDGYAFRDGQVYDVKWNRPTNDSVLYLTFPDGTPYPFKQGVTWFQPMGISSKIESKDNYMWRFEMHLP